MMGWAYSSDGEDKEYMQQLGGEKSWKTEDEMEIQFRGTDCKDVRCSVLFILRVLLPVFCDDKSQFSWFSFTNKQARHFIYYLILVHGV